MNTNAQKIAIVSDAIYPFNKGGKEKRLYEITTRLAAQGCDVTVYCMKWWDGNNTIVKDGVTFDAISPLYSLYSGSRRSISEAIFFALHCFKLLTKDFDVVDIDHMPHLVLFPTRIVCWIKRKRMIVTWHEVWGKEYWKNYLGGFGGTIAYIIERWSVMLPDVIISVSQHTTEGLCKTLGAKQEILTIPIGIDSKAIYKILSSNKKSDIIFAGRLLTHKNVDVLLRAIRILADNNPTISAMIVGEGPEKENLEKLSGELGLEKNVSFLGFVEDHDDLYALMQSSRVFVLPSTREGFGIAAIEANACGLPIITVDHKQNATRELVVNGENGIVTTLDERELADAIETLLDGNKGAKFYQKYAEKYDWNNIVPEIKKIYAI